MAWNFQHQAFGSQWWLHSSATYYNNHPLSKQFKEATRSINKQIFWRAYIWVNTGWLARWCAESIKNRIGDVFYVKKSTKEIRNGTRQSAWKCVCGYQTAEDFEMPPTVASVSMIPTIIGIGITKSRRSSLTPEEYSTPNHRKQKIITVSSRSCLTLQINGIEYW